ncbi:MAG: diguanylate cyclase [Tepidisphaerales bacterium]
MWDATTPARWLMGATLSRWRRAAGHVLTVWRERGGGTHCHRRGDGTDSDGSAAAAVWSAVLEAWTRTAERLSRLPAETAEPADAARGARELLVQFLHTHLHVRSVRFLPAGLVHQQPGVVSVTCAPLDEAVEVVPAAGWSARERLLVACAVGTTAGVLATLHRLAEAHAQSLTDPLTGLYNRRALSRLLEREVLLAGRHGTALSLAMVDLDHFKDLNDRCGHAAGDEVLRAVATTLSQSLRRSDLCFRYGGDEFCVILPQTAGASALSAMDKLRLAWGKVDASVRRGVTLSIGIAEHRRGLSPAGLLAAADAALYDAKSARRDCVRWKQAA